MVYLRKRRREKQQHSCSQKMLFLFPCLVIHHVTTQIYLVTPWESQPKGVEAVTKTLKRVKIYIYWKQNISAALGSKPYSALLKCRIPTLN